MFRKHTKKNVKNRKKNYLKHKITVKAFITREREGEKGTKDIFYNYQQLKVCTFQVKSVYTPL